MKKFYSKMVLAVVAAVLITGISAFASETDDRISSSAKDSYVFKTFLKDDAIKVQSKDDGVVTLTGTVAERSHKQLAEKTVESLPGVKSVDNQLEIEGEPLDERSDEWIRVKVNYSLLFHRHVSALKTQVSVTDGIVTLRGEAENKAQKDLTLEYVKDIDGVEDVKNEMTVASAPNEPQQTMAEMIDDASITAQVKLALLWRRSTSAFQTGVETQNGVVTLSGIVSSAAGKDMATKVVEDVKGVEKVVNNLTVNSKFDKINFE
ncbi:BON domain-containing protein [Candidatus Omnitrophota bacterium]